MKRSLAAAYIAAVLLIGPHLGGAAGASGGIDTHDLTTGLTSADLVESLLGPNVTASNVVYTGAPEAAGAFAGGDGIIGFDTGIVLSSGSMGGVRGPNVEDGLTTTWLGPGDADLDGLAGHPTFDAAVLEFDFVVDLPDPVVTLGFRYVFSSDEYNDYVNTQFNDVFAFMVDGVNCATVGNPPVPVSINTINNGNPDFDMDPTPTNPSLYRNNDLSDGGGAIDTEMDGLTHVLTCQSQVSTGQTHHLKLAIADATDTALDSNVLIEGGSLGIIQDTALQANPAVARVLPGNAVFAPELSAVLTREGGAPMAGRLVEFLIGAEVVCSDVTDGTGEAVCSDVQTSAAAILNLGYDARFNGSALFAPSAGHGSLAVVNGMPIG